MIKYLPLISLLWLGCKTHTNEDEHGFNFLVTENERDTVRFFYSSVPKGYDFFGNNEIDSVFLDALNLKKLNVVKHIFGLRKKDDPFNRYMFFKSERGVNFNYFHAPEDLFLHSEYGLEDYEVSLVDGYIQEHDGIPTMHQLLAAVHNAGDTLGFQELNFFEKTDYLTISLIAFRDLESRDEMERIMKEWTSELGK